MKLQHIDAQTRLLGIAATTTLTLRYQREPHTHPRPCTLELPLAATLCGLSVQLDDAPTRHAQLAPREALPTPRRLTRDHLRLELPPNTATSITLTLHTLSLHPTPALPLKPLTSDIPYTHALRLDPPALTFSTTPATARTTLRGRVAFIELESTTSNAPLSLSLDPPTTPVLYVTRQPTSARPLILVVLPPHIDAPVASSPGMTLTALPIETHALLLRVESGWSPQLQIATPDAFWKLDLPAPEDIALRDDLDRLWGLLRLRQLERGDLELHRDEILALSTHHHIPTSLTHLHLEGSPLPLPPQAFSSPELASRGFLERVARLATASLDRLIGESEEPLSFVEELLTDMHEARNDTRQRLASSATEEQRLQRQIRLDLDRDSTRDRALLDKLRALEARRVRTRALRRTLHRLERTLEEATRKRSLLQLRAQRSTLHTTIDRLRKRT